MQMQLSLPREATPQAQASQRGAANRRDNVARRVMTVASLVGGQRTIQRACASGDSYNTVQNTRESRLENQVGNQPANTCRFCTRMSIDNPTSNTLKPLRKAV